MVECERSLKARVVGIATLVGGGGRERGGMDECQRREREREGRWGAGCTICMFDEDGGEEGFFFMFW